MIFNNTQRIFIYRITDDCILSDNKFVKIYNFFVYNNYSVVDNSKNSDIIILDLCGFKNNFLTETNRKIDLYLSEGKKIVLFGCISDKFKEIYGDKLQYVKSKDYLGIEKIFNFKIGINKINSLNYSGKVGTVDLGSFRSYNKKLSNSEDISFLSISEGCSLNCSYCNIKKIKGDTVSNSLQNIISEINNEYNNKGKRIFYLLSDDCGSYGIDIGINFVDLIDEIFKQNDNIKLGITNIYPLFFIKFYDRIKKYIYSGKILFIVVPVQHTSDRILSLMSRKYSIEKLIEILKDIKENSKIELINHMIFDYHDESLDEFKDTFKLLQYYNKTVYIKFSDINNTFGNNLISNNLKEKVIMLKKLQLKCEIDSIDVVL